jgi:pseudouridine kinase
VTVGAAGRIGGAAGRVGGAVVCVGGAVLDRHLHLLAPPVPGTSNPAHGSSSAGGVARNVAENLARLGLPVRLVSRVGGDDAGRRLLDGLAASGVDASGVVTAPGEPTAQYVAVLDPGGHLVLGIAAMAVLDGLTCADLDANWPDGAGWVLVDCNLPAPLLAHARSRARALGTSLAVEAVSVPKVVRLAEKDRAEKDRAEKDRAAGTGLPLGGVTALFANLDEARALAGALGLDAAVQGSGTGCGTGDGPGSLAEALVGAGARTVVVTVGAQGAVLADATGTRAVPARPARVVDVTGAGDALVAATLAALVAGAPVAAAVRAGAEAAARTVESPWSVIPGALLAEEGGDGSPPAASFGR